MPAITVNQAFELALQHHQAGRLAEAEALYRQVLAAQPGHDGACHHLGLIAFRTGRNDLAVEWIGQALRLAPDNPIAWSNLGEVYRAAGRLDEAAASLQRAVHVDPVDPAAHFNLGNVFRDQGRFDEAIASFRHALGLKPDYAEAHNNLGVALKTQGRFDEALAAFREALRLREDYVDAYYNLGNAFRAQGELDGAVAAYQRALALQPDRLDAWNNLGDVLFHQGQTGEAIATYRRALQSDPHDAAVQSNIVFTCYFLPRDNGKLVAEEQERWNQAFAEPAKPYLRPHANDRTPERRLRIGYVSPDFRRHVVGRNLRPLFLHHDCQNFEILCYSGVKRPDDMTAEVQRRVQHWRTTVNVSDEALVEMIRQDQVDILVDLSQHSSRNRLPVFARQPAPLQVSFAGYTEATRLPTIAHRISDRYLEPEASDPVYLLESYWCYDPCGAEVAVNELPAVQNGRVTFGNLNNFCKVNEVVLKLWARVLASVRDARLVLLAPPGSHRERTLEFLGREGIGAERIEFVAPCPHQGYLELYHRMDVALDPFPYNGHTTSLDALWMGVPVVSLAGQRGISRAGLSQLTNLGLPELVAHSEDEYVDIATRLAHDAAGLIQLRRTLRHRMESCVLMDAPQFARGIETAYREMWRRWCATSTH